MNDREDSELTTIAVTLNKDVTDRGELYMELLRSEYDKFKECPYEEIHLVHFKVDWAEGMSDPTKTPFKQVAGVGLTDEQFEAGGVPCSIPGIDLDPEFWLSYWCDSARERCYPARLCKHWVNIQEGDVHRAVEKWDVFNKSAEQAGNLAEGLGILSGISDPVQRWLIVLHHILCPERKIFPFYYEPGANREPPVNSLRLGDIYMVRDWFGIEVLDDLVEASCRVCLFLLEGVDHQMSETQREEAASETPAEEEEKDTPVEAEWSKLVESNEESSASVSMADDDEAEPDGSPRQSMSIEDANKKAMILAKADSSFVDKPQRGWAEAIGCSAATVAKTGLWKKTMEKTGRGRKDRPKKPKTVALSEAVEATHGEGEKHEVLKEVIRQHEADSESSPLDSHGKNPRVHRD